MVRSVQYFLRLLVKNNKEKKEMYYMHFFFGSLGYRCFDGEIKGTYIGL